MIFIRIYTIEKLKIYKKIFCMMAKKKRKNLNAYSRGLAELVVAYI